MRVEGRKFCLDSFAVRGGSRREDRYGGAVVCSSVCLLSSSSREIAPELPVQTVIGQIGIHGRDGVEFSGGLVEVAGSECTAEAMQWRET